MSYTVCDYSVVLPTKKSSSSFSSGYGSKKPRALIKIELEEGFEREIWIPVRVARALLKDKPSAPFDFDEFRKRIDGLERSCALTMVTEMLSRRDHASGEVRDKLGVYGFHPASIEYAVRRATELRFLDDRRFCSYFIEERKRRGWGRRKVEVELKRRHIVPEDIPGYPEEFFAEEDDAERARELLSKRRVADTRPFEKFVRFLMGKGFSYGIAADAAKQRIAQDRACSEDRF